ncbi:MAG: hypothetical protein H0U64_02055 [Gemmatimonadaceae bacterium]|nr:hypothetical protein [Gemmatimonadaceae bacterium]
MTFVIAGAISLTLALLGVAVRWGVPGMSFITIAPLAWANAHFREKKRPTPALARVPVSRELPQ